MRNLIMFLGVFFCVTIPLFSHHSTEEWEKYQTQVLEEQKKFPGWCPQEKAKRIMDIVLNEGSAVCVEVGVYGGSSFFPLASTLAFRKEGMSYAIDPWYNTPCLEGYQEDADEKMFNYWGKIDLEKVMQKFINGMNRNNLDQYYTIIRLNSSEAALLFADASIDFLHIDGNHSEEVSTHDVRIWLPKVKAGGIICFDDAWWESTQKAINILRQSCHLMKSDSSGIGQYIFFRKP